MVRRLAVLAVVGRRGGTVVHGRRGAYPLGRERVGEGIGRQDLERGARPPPWWPWGAARLVAEGHLPRGHAGVHPEGGHGARRSIEVELLEEALLLRRGLEARRLLVLGGRGHAEALAHGGEGEAHAVTQAGQPRQVPQFGIAGADGIGISVGLEILLVLGVGGVVLADAHPFGIAVCSGASARLCWCHTVGHLQCTIGNQLARTLGPSCQSCIQRNICEVRWIEKMMSANSISLERHPSYLYSALRA